MEKKIRTKKVWKLEYNIASIHDESVSVEEYLLNDYAYNTNGDVLSESTYDAAGNLIERLERDFNEDGKLTGERLFYDKNKLAEERTFELNDNGKIATEKVRYEEGNEDISTYVYMNGLLVEKTSIDEDGDFSGKETHEYEGEKLMATKLFDEDNQMIMSYEFQYNENGDIVYSREYDGLGGYVNENKRFYNEDGVKTEEIEFVDEKPARRYIFHYDDQKNVIGIDDQTADGLTKVSLNYDDNGNAIEQLEVDEEGEVMHKIERKYDDHSNMLESKVFISGNGMRIDQHYHLRFEYEFFD